MGAKGKEIVLLALALLCAGPGLSAQKKEQKDSLVRLIKAANVQLLNENGRAYRRSLDATFLHNGTYFICDTALYNVEERVLNATGNVKVVQDETILTSQKMDYFVDDNLIVCRGGVVQLEDSDHNTLRTYTLDYNTLDSIAFFQNGASMRDSEGQIIESREGRYDARRKVFSFRDDVNMFTDSVFIKTSMLDYESRPNRAIFLAYIDFWKEGNMLSAGGGWYDRPSEVFFFEKNVHGTTDAQEAWCDSLFYYRLTEDVLLLGHAQLQDTTRDVAAVGGRIHYIDSLSRIKLSREAAVALRTTEEVPVRDEEGNKVGSRQRIDTLYFGADSITYRTVPMCDIPDNEFKEAETRKADIYTDPVQEYRQKALEAARKAAEEAKKKMEGNSQTAGSTSAEEDAPPPPPPPEEEVPPPPPPPPPAELEDSLTAPADSLSAPSDSLAAPSDSLGVPADSPAAPAEPADSTRMGFMEAKGHVKVYRYDLQMVCDSLRYNDLDSIARFYIDPVAWSDGRRQYSADSLFALVAGRSVDRVSLLNNAFIITKEDSLLFDQIKGTEVMAYFDTTGTLKRFDALGGASAIFYLREKEAIATVNKVETKMMSALFKDGNIDQVYYFDSPKNDAYPIPQLKSEDRSLKGFNWQQEIQPKGKEDITDLTVRPSERAAYESRPRAQFRQTNIFFPGYMSDVYRSIEDARRRREERRRQQEALKAMEEAAAADTLSAAVDSLAVPLDSLAAAVDSLAVPLDSLAAGLDSLGVPRDSLAAGSDSLHAVADSLAAADSLGVEPVVDEKALKKAEWERKKAEKEAAREARWAQLDSLDAAKAAAKLAKKEARKKARIEKQLKRIEAQNERDRKKLERYVEMYRRRKAREDARAAAKAAAEAAKAAAEAAAEAAEAPADSSGEPGSETPEDTTLNTTDDGKDTRQVPPLREGGHPEQRGLTDSTLDKQTAEPPETSLQRAE